MKISALNNSNIRFKNSQYEYDYDPSAQARRIMRNRIEESLGCEYLYLNQLQHLTSEQIYSQLNQLASANLYAKEKKSNTNKFVNYQALQNLKLFVRQKRKNELYSGGMLIKAKNGVETAAKSGIKTVVCLVPDFDSKYEKAVKNAGMNFLLINDIGNKKLRALSITSDLCESSILRRLIRNPKEWATVDETGKIKENAKQDICDMQDFFDILDGKNPQFPLPIYFGCEYGSERTYAWTTIYNILSGEDKTKPLSEDAVKKLIKFEKEESDY